MIPYGKQLISDKDKQEVLNALGKDLITTGNYTLKLEKLLSKKVGSKFSLSCNSGTSAIYLALKSLPVKKNDIIIMPIVNFVASLNVSMILGLKIYFTDVCPLTGVMREQDLEECIKKNNIKNIKVVIRMFMGGYPINIDKFKKLKKKYNFYLVDDACHALGAKFFYHKKYRNVGSCISSDINTFSFHPLKSITSGEGGAITTNNQKIYQRLLLLRNHGIKRKNHFQYDVVENSLNFRLSDINCALAYSQLKNLNFFMFKRKKISEFYDKKLIKYKIFKIIKKTKKYLSSNHLYILNIDFEKTNTSKLKLIKYLLKKGIYSQQHYIPLNKFTIFKKNFSQTNFANAKLFFKNSLSIPIFVSLSQKTQIGIIKNILSFFKLK